MLLKILDEARMIMIQILNEMKAWLLMLIGVVKSPDGRDWMFVGEPTVKLLRLELVLKMIHT